MWLPNSTQVMESISGSVMPLAMFGFSLSTWYLSLPDAHNSPLPHNTTFHLQIWSFNRMGRGLKSLLPSCYLPPPILLLPLFFFFFFFSSLLLRPPATSCSLERAFLTQVRKQWWGEQRWHDTGLDVGCWWCWSWSWLPGKLERTWWDTYGSDPCFRLECCKNIEGWDAVKSMK